MKLKKLKFKNFKSYGDYETELDLSFTGIKLIVGENGMGKSTFFDAVLWGFYGVSKVNVDELVNRTTKKNCKVENIFEVGNSTYSIIRYRKHEKHGNKLLLFKDGVNITMSKASDTQAVINEIIQISYQAMTSSVVVSSELYSSFLRSTPGDRIKIFESVLSLKEVSEYAKKLKKLRTPLLEEMAKIDSTLLKKISGNDALKTTINSYIEKTKSSLKALDVEKEEKQKEVLLLETKLSEYLSMNVSKELETNKDYDERVEETLRINNDISLENNRLKDIAVINNKLELINSDLETYSAIDVAKERKALKVQEDNDIIKSKLIEQTKLLFVLDPLSLKLEELKTKLKSYCEINIKEEKALCEESDRITKNNTEINLSVANLKATLMPVAQLKKTVATVKDDIVNKLLDIKNLKEHTDKCPTCRQTVNAEISNSILEKEVVKKKEIENNLSVVEKELEGKIADNVSVINEIKKLELGKEKEIETNYKLPYLNTVELEVSTLELQIKTTNETYNANKESNKTVNTNIDNLKSQLVENVETCSFTDMELGEVDTKLIKLKTDKDITYAALLSSTEYNKEILERVKTLTSSIREKLAEPKYHTILLLDIVEKQKELELQAEELRSEIVVIDTMMKSSYDKSYVSETKEIIKEEEKNIRAFRTVLKKKKKEDKLFDILNQVLSNKDSGFKKFFISKMIKIFNDKVNFYLPLFFESQIKIEFQKDLSEIITKDGVEVSFNSFSSGQKTRFDLAVSFSMFFMVKTIFSSTVSMLVFDEILDKNLDVRGFNSVVEILENLSKTSAIFAVSHQDFYKTKFNHHIQIKQDDDEFSFIANEI